VKEGIARRIGCVRLAAYSSRGFPCIQEGTSRVRGSYIPLKQVVSSKKIQKQLENQDFPS
jgi:hypothetical protein